MNEDDFVESLKKSLAKRVGKKYEVASKANLLYRVVVNPNGDFVPKDSLTLKRGQNAFQVDLLIGRKKKNGFMLPLVAMEVKYGGVSTHDIITYSGKAVKHKGIYPYLRYGMIVGNVKNVPYKFFVHNVGIDFLLAVEDESDERIKRVIRGQLRIAERLIKTMSGQRWVKTYESKVILE